MRQHRYVADESFWNAYSDNAKGGAAPKPLVILEESVEFARLLGFEPDAKVWTEGIVDPNQAVFRTELQL